MMKIHNSDFTKLTINDVSDILLEDITDEKKSATALCCGHDNNGKKYKLTIKLEVKEDE